MPLFGAHMSIAGGVTEALVAAEKFGCETVQLFSKNASQWKGKEQPPEEILAFRKNLKRLKLKFATAHDSYLINLASPDDALYRKSLEAFADEIERAEALGLSYLVTHPGAHMGTGDEAGLDRIATALDEIAERHPDCHVQVLLETTAGQGTTLGHRFEHLAGILDRVNDPDRLGVCLDTCHVFAAGYDIANEAGYLDTFKQFGRIVGLKKLKLFHVNDSMKPLASRVDRHAHLGEGCIGLEAFRLLVNDSRFKNKPMILETPKEKGDNAEMDAVNLGVLRGLMAG